jgi:hypothetical protein
MKEQLRAVAKEYARQFGKIIGIEPDYWTGGDLSLGSCLFGDYFFVLNDMQIVVDNLDKWVKKYGTVEKVGNEVIEWIEFVTEHYPRQPRINLYAWMDGYRLTAALKDLDFNRQLSKMYEGYAKRLYDSRNMLERFILRKHDNELSEETYKAFIINLLEERKQRQGDTLDEEFGTFDLDNWHGKKKHAEEFGKEVTSWFEDMTRQISEKTAENFKLNMEIRGKRRVIEQQQDEIERLKQRTMWERITRKGE